MRLAVFDDEIANIEIFKGCFTQEYDLLFENQSLQYEAVLKKGPFDAIIIDIHMPFLSGFELFAKIQSHPAYNGCPLIYCTSDRTDSTNLDGLKMGADDLINRFWGPEIIRERIYQQIIKYKKRNILSLEGLTLDLAQMKVELHQKQLDLTFTQFKILTTVLKNYPRSISKELLVKSVWDHQSHDSVMKSLATHLSNLRVRLEGWKFYVSSKDSIIHIRESQCVLD